MRLTVTPGAQQLRIRGYAAGKIQIGEQEFDHALLIGIQRVLGELRPQQPAELEESDLAPVFAEQPEVVLIGWARGQTFLPAAQRRWFLERGIGLEVMELGAACRTFNVLAGDGRRVMAMLFPR
ncbi:MAG: hypothetical protein KJS95_05855 [Gammaproteobacteria bacterium]|nr:hypothetical protein [Gammaproteobacteria bacterium]